MGRGPSTKEKVCLIAGERVREERQRRWGGGSDAHIEPDCRTHRLETKKGKQKGSEKFWKQMGKKYSDKGDKRKGVFNKMRGKKYHLISPGKGGITFQKKL